MTTLGDFQPIFELATGIHLGVSGLLAIFDDPRDRQIKQTSQILKSLRNLRRNAESSIESIRTELDDAIFVGTRSLDDAVRQNQSYRTYTRAKIASVMLGLGSIAYVSYCSDNSGLDIHWTTRMWGYIFLLSPLVIVFMSLRPAYRAAGGIAKVRETLDNVYDKMVFEVYKKGGTAV